MAGRRFEVADVVEVLQHWQAGQSVRHLARSLGVGRDRVRAIIGAATTAGLSPDARLRGPAEAQGGRCYGWLTPETCALFVIISVHFS
jgi:hypothetical protein